MRKATDGQTDRQAGRREGSVFVLKYGKAAVLLASRCALRRTARRIALLSDSGESKFHSRRISSGLHSKNVCAIKFRMF